MHQKLNSNYNACVRVTRLLDSRVMIVAIMIVVHIILYVPVRLHALQHVGDRLNAELALEPLFEFASVAKKSD